MIPEPQQEQAALYALGALPPEEAAAFAAEMAANVELHEFTRSLEATAALVARGIPTAAPSPQLRDKVMARIDAIAGTRPTMPPVLNFIESAGQSGWKALPIPGAFIKLLSLERDRGYAVLMGKLEAGTRYPAHINSGPEEFYILTGDLVIGDRKLVAGDFHHAAQGSQHEENYSIEGCTLLAVLTTDDPLVAFALS
jgi:anti-sigma factor ChrR (cupin superfamily)